MSLPTTALSVSGFKGRSNKLQKLGYISASYRGSPGYLIRTNTYFLLVHIYILLLMINLIARSNVKIYLK